MKRGFTLVEVLLVMGIMAILATLAGINYFTTYSHASINAALDVLVADIKSAQANAMSGLGQNGVALDGWGLKVNSPTVYTLFPGSIYDPNNPDNIQTVLGSNITISTTLPSSSIAFKHGSGEVVSYVTDQDSLTLTSGTATRTIRFNQYGAQIGD